MPSRGELRQATQEKVLAAATALFLERGFRETTVRDIATAAGVSVGSVMATGDKRALLVRMFDRAIEQTHGNRAMTETRAHAAGSAADPDTEAERVFSLLVPFMTIFGTQLELAREYAAILMSGSHSSVVFDDLAALLLADIEAVLRESGVPPERVAVGAQTVYLAYLGTLFVWAGSGSSDNAGPLEQLRSTIRFVVRSEEYR